MALGGFGSSRPLGDWSGKVKKEDSLSQKQNLGVEGAGYKNHDTNDKFYLLHKFNNTVPEHMKYLF
jgi:hypothetical protein